MHSADGRWPARLLIAALVVAMFLLFSPLTQTRLGPQPVAAAGAAAPQTGKLPPPPPTLPPTVPPAGTPAATAPPNGTPAATATPGPPSFSDVHPSDYFYTAVMFLAARGVISGYADGTFRPYNSTTRSQMVKIVVLALGVPSYVPPGGAYTFADVPPAFPFFSYIEAGYHAHMINGYDCGGPGEPCDAQHRPYFRPFAYVTRGQLTKIIVGAAGWALRNPSQATFADVPPASPFYPYIETAVCRQIISGYTCGGPGEPCDAQQHPYFRYGNNAVRGQIAKIVYGTVLGPLPCAVGTVTP